MLVTILATIVVLSVLILVHEFGHFFAAKSVDIEVKRFSLGMGPRVAGFHVGETEFVLSALPIGGYVTMAGMQDDEMVVLEGGETPPGEKSERDFDSKPLWARAWVISAGVIMNFLFAFVVFVVSAAVYGERIVPPVVGAVQPGSPAARAGLQAGDRIVAAAGRPVASFGDLTQQIRPRAGRLVPLEVHRGADRLRLSITPASARDTLPDGQVVAVGQIGVFQDTLAPVLHRPLGVGQAVTRGAEATGRTTGLIFGFLGNLISGAESPRNVGSILTVGKLSGETARMGADAFLGFLAFFSINLAVLNLLPIPVLDGGHLLFMGIEAVRGRPLSLEQRIRLSQVGLFVIVGLMVWAMTNDVLRVFGI